MSLKVGIMIGSLSGGGMERVAAQLSVMLSDAGAEVYFFLCGFDKRKAYEYKGKINVIPYTCFIDQQEIINEFTSLLHDAYCLSKIKRKYELDFTISFAPEMNVLNLLSGVRDKKILSIHSCLSERKDLFGLYYHRYFFKMYNHSYKVITVSRWCKKDLVENYGIRRNKIKVIYNSVDTVNLQHSLSSKSNFVLVVGRLHDVKQQWHIIRAFKEVKNKITDVKLLIAGTGKNAAYLRKLSKEIGIENEVIFKGFVEDMQELYRKAKLVVLASSSEAFPCSVIEALSYGVPVISADCPGGIREILARRVLNDKVIQTYTPVECGILVPRLDGKKYGAEVPLTQAEHEMAKAIMYLLENEQIRNKMERECLKRSRLFEKKKIWNQWKEILFAE